MNDRDLSQDCALRRLSGAIFHRRYGHHMMGSSRIVCGYGWAEALMSVPMEKSASAELRLMTGC